MTFQEFDLDVKYRPGSKMLHIDTISRGPAEDKECFLNSPTKTVKELIAERLDVCTMLNKEEIVAMAQQANPLIKQIKTILF